MDKFLLALALLALAGCANAALNAGTDTKVVDIANCGQENGPATRSIQVSIMNEWDAAMLVDYEYYDFPSQTWKSAGRACVVPAKQLGKCQISLRVALGGEGTGTVTQDMVRLVGTNDETGETETKVLGFIINHYPGDREKSRMGEIDAAFAKISEVNASLNETCAGDVCCGLAQEREALRKAESLLAGSRQMVKECRLVELYLDYVNATSEINKANGTDVVECKALLPVVSSAAENAEYARLAIKQGEACRANVLGAKDLLAQYETVFGSAVDALASDDYASASSLLPQAVELASQAEDAVGECGGEIWERENLTETDLGPNTTGGFSEYREQAAVEGEGGGCIGMVAVLSALAFTALARFGA